MGMVGKFRESTACIMTKVFPTASSLFLPFSHCKLKTENRKPIGKLFSLCFGFVSGFSFNFLAVTGVCVYLLFLLLSILFVHDKKKLVFKVRNLILRVRSPILKIFHNFQCDKKALKDSNATLMHLNPYLLNAIFSQCMRPLVSKLFR